MKFTRYFITSLFFWSLREPSIAMNLLLRVGAVGVDEVRSWDTLHFTDGSESWCK